MLINQGTFASGQQVHSEGTSLACRDELDWRYTKLQVRRQMSKRASLHYSTPEQCSRAANARTQVYKWLLQELRPENHSTTDARNMVSTPRMVVRAYSSTSFHL